MSLKTTLAMVSAGALMLIGQPATAQDPQDRGVDREAQVHAQTGDERTGPTVRTRSQVWTEADEDEDEDEFDDEFVAQDDEFDDEFVAQDDEFVQDDEVGVRDDEFLAQDDEFRTDEFATEDEFVAEERIETTTELEEEGTATDLHVHERTEAGVDTRTTMAGQQLCPCPPEGQVGVDWQVDETRLNTLARINVEMLDETRELADRIAATQDASEAQELQLQLLERQMQVIERHGWSREEYNAVVSHVNEDQDLRTRYIDTVVQQDAQVAGEFETEGEIDAEGEFETAGEFETEDDLEGDFEVTAEVDTDDDEEDELLVGEFEEDDRR